MNQSGYFATQKPTISIQWAFIRIFWTMSKIVQKKKKKKKKTKKRKKILIEICVRSSSFLTVTRRTTIISRMSSNFSQIRRQTAFSTDQRLLRVVAILAPPFFDRIFSILDSNKDNLNISDEFEFQPDSTTYRRVICPRAFGKIPIDLSVLITGHIL